MQQRAVDCSAAGMLAVLHDHLEADDGVVLLMTTAAAGHRDGEGGGGGICRCGDFSVGADTHTEQGTCTTASREPWRRAEGKMK